MKIREVKTAKKVGEFILRENNSPNKIKVKWTINDKSVLTDNSPRVYIFTSNEEIKKIGGSATKGGIKATLSFYENAMSGSPGPSRFIIHRLIEEELKKGKKVEIYLIISPKTKAKVCGLFDCNQIIEVASFKETENKCKEDYFDIEGKYPDWNFQENNEDYPKGLYNEYLNYHKNRIKNKKR